MADYNCEMFRPRSILITGASSGIGTALADALTEPGARLFLSGRDKDRLKAQAKKGQTAGAEVQSKVVDVTDSKAMAAWIKRCDEATPLDLVIANAGISGGTGGPDLDALGNESDRQVRRILDVNVNGVLNTVHPAIDVMAPRRSGQIAIISSIAGFRGLPTAPSYAASKACVKAYGEGLRPNLTRAGIKLSVVCPGFVTSRMTDKNDFPMPFKMPAARAAQIIKRGLAEDKARIVFPWQMSVLAWLMSALPPEWLDGYLARQTPKC